MRQQQILQKLNELKAQYISDYTMPLNYPAQVKTLNDGDTNDESTAQVTLRSDVDFINARLLEAGLPLGGVIPNTTASTHVNPMTLSKHNEAASRFINDLQGTGCYDAVQVYFGNSTQQEDNDNNNTVDVTVKLKEKNWYKLYVGGGVNSDDLSSLGDGGGGNNILSNESLNKLQFETSASLLNITGFADVSTASYSVDPTGASSFKFIHDRPLCSWLPKNSSLYEFLMPRDPTLIDPNERQEENNFSNNNDMDEQEVYMNDDAQYSLGGGSHTTLGVHAVLDELDYELTRSYKEFTRSVGIRLANHCRGAARGPGMGGANKPSVAPPESMAGPYMYLDWSAKLRDLLPRRHAQFPFALDCSKEVACQSGTALHHSLTGGVYLNGCFTDDRYDPTMGYDAHFMGEISGPPGDVGYWKMKGGASWHWPLALLRMMVFGVQDEAAASDEEEPGIIGMTLHSSLNAGIIRPLTFNGLCNNSSFRGIPLSDRFYIGGPGQIRGFLPAGIGPRATKVTCSFYLLIFSCTYLTNKFNC